MLSEEKSYRIAITTEVENEKVARGLAEEKLEKIDHILSDALQDIFVLFVRLEAFEKSLLDLKTELKFEFV